MWEGKGGGNETGLGGGSLCFIGGRDVERDVVG
jgi:hypothetical protein